METAVISIQCPDHLRMKVEVLARLERRLLEDQLICLIDEGMQVFETVALAIKGEPRTGETAP